MQTTLPLPTKFVYQPVFSAMDGDDNSLSEMPFTAYTIGSFDESLQEDLPSRKSKGTLTSFTLEDAEDYLEFEEIPQITIPSCQELRLMSPQLRPKSNSSRTGGRRSGDKTPKTQLKMMERHRESERVRHHTLNELMKNVCDVVPGYTDVSKETKVVMMQRIISYICYLENTISTLCDKLNVKVGSLRLSTNFLTSQWKMGACLSAKSRKQESNITAIKCKANEKPAKKRVEKIEKRRLKISSPTIDSTTDLCDHMLNEDPLPKYHEQEDLTNSSQGSNVPTSCTTIGELSKTYDAESTYKHRTQNSFCDPEQFVETPTKYFNNDIMSTSTSLDTFPDPFDLMSSPVGKRYSGLLSPKLDTMMKSPVGIQSDQRDLNETLEMGESEMRTVSPECILQTTLSSQEEKDGGGGTRMFHYSMFASGNTVKFSTPGRIISKTPVKSPVILGKNKRKQYTPRRSPFHEVTNYLRSPEKELYGPVTFDEPRPKRMRLDTDLMPGKFARQSPVDGDFVSYVPYIWKFHSGKFTKRQKAERPECEPLSPSKENADGSEDKPEKVDHRKTTWMNGFMMFSRLNRKSFISANPGVHTSQISKMMGHAWRNMSTEEQQPYKEKARECASRMKLRSPFLDSNDGSNDSTADAKPTKNNDDDCTSYNDRRVPHLY